MSKAVIPSRGRVYWATLDGMRKPWLVVSNNPRNRALGTCLAVRITTSQKPELDTIVELGPQDAPLRGRVLCDDIAVLFPSEDGFEHLGAITTGTMLRVDAGLRAALALR
jgi:mRNA interferase MazF